MKNVNIKKIFAITALVTAVSAMSVTAFAASMYKAPDKAAANMAAVSAQSTTPKNATANPSASQAADSDIRNDLRNEMRENMDRAAENKNENSSASQSENGERSDWSQRMVEECERIWNEEDGRGMMSGRGGRGCF